PVDVLGDPGPVLALVRADEQVLPYGQVTQGPAPLGHVGYPEASDLVRAQATQAPAVEGERATGADHATDGAQRRRLPGAVRPEDPDGATVLEAQGDAVEDLDAAVGGGDV